MKTLIFILGMFTLALVVACIGLEAKAEVPSNLKMKCISVASRMGRCENEEVVCYKYNGESISCFKKTSMNNHVLWVEPDGEKK